MMAPKKTPVSAFIIGGSAGSIDILKNLLPKLPKDPADRTFAIVCVLHLLPSGQSLLPSIYQRGCPWTVKEAESTEKIENGVVYFGPPDYHLSVEADRTFALSTEEPQMYSRPSINLFFMTAAAAYKSELVALILSGANADGAQGFREILRMGGRCLAQAPETAEFPEMPRAALAVSPEVSSMNPAAVVEFLNGRS